MDISTLSLIELRELERLIPKELKRRESEEKAKAKKELQAFAQARGFNLDDLVGGIPVVRVRRSRATGPLPPKYRNPNDPSQTWSGRGRKPGWLETLLAQGRLASEFEVQE
ncbi:MAG: H-NS histone family protein [Zoogloeaceae bacterium]|jgi:DNA-binding protein H-NS|nr:H-NS histone family protein [Zoogloeaceae bacterium]